jgi:hypothetical protein
MNTADEPMRIQIETRILSALVSPVIVVVEVDILIRVATAPSVEWHPGQPSDDSQPDHSAGIPDTKELQSRDACPC